MSQEGKHLLLGLVAVILILAFVDPISPTVSVLVPEAMPVSKPVEAHAGVRPQVTLVSIGEELRLNPEAMLRKPKVLRNPVSVRPLIELPMLGVQCSIDW